MDSASLARRWFAKARVADVALLGFVATRSPLSRLIRPDRLPILKMVVWLYRYVRLWLLVWVAVWLIDPRFVVSSRAGVQTLLQVTPAVLVAVLVFAVGAAFAIIQAVVATYGMRGALLVSIDPLVATTVLRPLVVLFAALLMSGQVPDAGRPAAAVAAAGATVVLATLFCIVVAAMTLPAAFAAFLAPVNFGRKATADVDYYFRTGALGMVGFRVGLLEQMLTSSLRRGDAVGAGGAIGALGRLHWAYIAAVPDHPSIREYTYDTGTVVGWFGIEVSEALARCGEVWLASRTSEDLYVKLADALSETGQSFARRGLQEEADAIIMAHIRLATSIYQVSAIGVVNSWVAAAPGLAAMEAVAEETGHESIAVPALAAWCLATSYIQTQFGRPLHPDWVRGIHTFGPNAPFDAAALLILSPGYTARLGAKMPMGPVHVIGNLAQAKDAHEHRDDVDYVPMPLRPVDNDDVSAPEPQSQPE